MGKPRLTDEQRGPLGAWAYHARIAAGYTNTDQVVPLLGLRLRSDTLRGIESGHTGASPEVLGALEALYGATAPTVATETPAGGVGALWAVVDVLREDVARLQGKVATLEAALVAGRSTERTGQ